MAKELEPAVWTDTSDSDESVHYFIIGSPINKRKYRCESWEQAIGMRSAYCEEIGITKKQFDEWSKGVFDEMPSKKQLLEMLSVHRCIYGNPRSAYLDFEERAVQAVALYLLQEEEFKTSFTYEFLTSWRNEPVETDELRKKEEVQ